MVGGWCTLDFSVSSGPFLSFEIEIGHGPGKCEKIELMLCSKENVKNLGSLSINIAKYGENFDRI